MRFATVLAVTFAMALTDAAPVVQAEGAVPDIPHRDPTDYYKVVAALRTEPANGPLQKTYTGASEATEGITAQQAKRWLMMGDPTPNTTEPVRPQLPKTKPQLVFPLFPKTKATATTSTRGFDNPYFEHRLWPCFGLCERFMRKHPSIFGLLLCPCTLTDWNASTTTTTTTEGHGPKETGMPSSTTTTTEGHGPKETGKPSSTTPERHGPKETGKPSSTTPERHGPMVTEKPQL